jgi:hypothetical protein
VKTADADIHLETRAEIFRVAKRCAPCLDTLGPITFLANPASEQQRRAWIEATWQPIVSVSLRKSQTLCRRPHTSLIAVDRELDERLAGPLAKSSRAAGLRLASYSRAPAGETCFSNYIQTVLQGESPGHFAIVFGARAGLFDIPPHIARAALLFLEMRAARLQDLWPAIEDCLSFSPEPLKKLQAV